MLEEVRRIADAVLYEGYILYPYRASAQKNRSRWQFGVLMPPGYDSEPSAVRAECVFEAADSPSASVDVLVRFLQIQRGPSSWDQAVAHEISVVSGRFDVPGGAGREPLTGSVSIRVRPLPGPWRASRLTVQVTNETGTPHPPSSRQEALPFALVAAHLIIRLSGGSFISMTDPPEWASHEVSACSNTGCWPVLAGPPGSRDVMLAAPIILPDYPSVAPESAGELYDGTENDEILTLRTLALSDAEKAEARATDPRAAALIDRVDAMDAPAMERLHGTIRSRTPVGGDSVVISGHHVTRGSRVVLRPGIRRADAQDMFLAGRTAIVEAVLTDVADTVYLAVTLEDDPGADLRNRFLYFAPDEVSPCEA